MTVYFAVAGPYVKIGYSQNPERRVARLFCSATPRPHDCPTGRGSRQLIRTIDGDKHVEAAIHRALDDFCVGAEWFAYGPPVADFIASVEPDRYDYPRLAREGGPREFVEQHLPERFRPPADYDEDAVMARLGYILSGGRAS